MARSISRDDSEIDVLTATLYAVARDERIETADNPNEVLEWIIWVIRNRALNKPYYAGRTLKGVCLAPLKFECWNNTDYIDISDEKAFRNCQRVVYKVLGKRMIEDPTRGCVLYNNIAKAQTMPSWTKYCTLVKIIKKHHFYKM